MKRTKSRRARSIEPMLTGVATTIGVNPMVAEIAVDTVNHRPLSGKMASDLGTPLQSNPLEGRR